MLTKIRHLEIPCADPRYTTGSGRVTLVTKVLQTFHDTSGVPGACGQIVIAYGAACYSPREKRCWSRQIGVALAQLRISWYLANPSAQRALCGTVTVTENVHPDRVYDCILKQITAKWKCPKWLRRARRVQSPTSLNRLDFVEAP